MKIKSTIVVLLIFIMLLSFTSCSVNNKRIDAKYISIYDEERYLIFKKDGSVLSSMSTTIENGERIPSDHFQYTIDANGVITAIDKIEYEGQDSLDKYEIGIMYKDYICLSCDGMLSEEYTDMTILNRLSEDLILTYTLNEDKTYEFIATYNNEVESAENGTYSINNNEVVCTSDEGIITTFIDIDGKTYCIEYVKED